MHQIHDSLATLAVNIDTLTPDPENARVHTDRNLDSIAASLRAYGQRKPIVVQRREDTYIIRAGNGTVEAARRLGWSEVAAVVMDEDDITAAAYGLADNRTAELASWDEGVLARVLGRISTEADDYDPMNMGFEEAEVIKLLAEHGALMGDLASLDLDIYEDDDSDGQPNQTQTNEGTQHSAQELGELQTSAVVMVQLFLAAAEHGAFLEAVHALAKIYGTTDITATVVEAVRREAQSRGAA